MRPKKVAPSPALSQIGQTWPTDGRLIGIVVDPADLDGVRTVRETILAGGMVPLLMIHSLQKNAQPKGMQIAELSWILEDNRPMRSMIEALDASAYKTYRVYEKSLA